MMEITMELNGLDVDDLGAAIAVAVAAHTGQKDKAGKPYILHPLRVMLSLSDHPKETQMVAVLHDVVEDTDWTLEQIAVLFGTEVAQGVDAVTRRDGEVYVDFVRRSKAHPIGRVVKIADVKDNMSPSRMDALPEHERGMVSRYKKALELLEEG